MEEFFKTLMSILVPPGLTPTVKHRLAVSAWLAVLTFHVFWACGWMDWAGLQGFALASDQQQLREQTGLKVGELTDKVDALREERLQDRLLEARRLSCITKEPAAKSYYADRIAAMQSEMQRAFKHEVQLPTCEQLL